MKQFPNIQQKTSLVQKLPLTANFCVITFLFMINSKGYLTWVSIICIPFLYQPQIFNSIFWY